MLPAVFRLEGQLEYVVFRERATRFELAQDVYGLPVILKRRLPVRLPLLATRLSGSVNVRFRQRVVGVGEIPQRGRGRRLLLLLLVVLQGVAYCFEVLVIFLGEGVPRLQLHPYV